MPYKERDIEKLYYSIGEVAEQFDVSASLLRYWEQEFDQLKPKKNRKGNRLYTKKDIAEIQIIYHLVKENGYTIDGAKRKLKDKGKIYTNIQLIEKLQKVKGFLEDLKGEL